MKISYLVNNINQVGGIERVVCRLSSYFADAFDYEVSIHSVYTAKTKTWFPLSEKVTVYHYGVDWRDCDRKNLIHVIGTIMQSLDSDVLITCHCGFSAAAILNKRLFLGKLIVTEHSVLDNHTKKRQILNKLLYRFADGVVVLLKSEQEKYHRAGVAKCVTIPNAVSFRRETMDTCDNKVILSVGRLEYVKGYDMLIKAFNQVHMKYPDWKLRIVGDGGQREALESLIEAYGLKPAVELPGVSQNVENEMSSAAVYVLSSRSEGFGLVLVEAWEAGLPCVAFNIDAIQSLASDDIVVKVKENNVDELALGIMKIIESPELADSLRKNAKKEAKKYHIDTVAAIWKDYFLKL